MHKKRLLVIISYSFSIRYIIRTGLLQHLKEFCVPVIVITWPETTLMNELKHAGFEVYVVPENRRGVAYSNVRRKVDIWFNHFRLKSPSPKIEQHYLDVFRTTKSRLLRKFREYYNVVKLYVPAYQQRLLKEESELLLKDTNLQELSTFVERLNIDAVFTVTPFHQQEDILLRACMLLNKRMVCSILSFDNITKRGWMPVDYDAYMVWNEDNKRQLHRIYPGTRNKPVTVTGAAQFDVYFQPGNVLDLQEWEKLVGIPAGNRRRIILYSGGPQALFPQEPVYLKAIDNAISDGRIKGQPLILFRCHPIDDIGRWMKAVGTSPNIIYDKSWTGQVKQGYTNVTEEDLKKLFATLAHTDVHVNLCSTMTVDGAAFGKPQIGPAYMPGNSRGGRLLKKLYEQEHFLPVLQSGVLQLATSELALVQLINDALVHASNGSDNCRMLLQNVITYYDGHNTERVSNALLHALN